MKRHLRFLPTLAALLTLAFTVFLSASPTPRAEAQDITETNSTIRFVHVYSGGGPIDIYVDNNLLVQNLAFGTATEYASVPEGDRHVQVVATGEQPDKALIDKTITADKGAAYDILIGGQKDQLDARSYQVNVDDLDVGQVRMRFIQGEPGAGNIDIALIAPTGDDTAVSGNDNSNSGGTGGDTTGGGSGNSDTSGFPTFNGISDSTDYQTINSGTYGMVVNSSDNAGDQINLPDIVLSSGHVYDVVVLGTIASGNLTLLPLITAVADPCSQLVGVGQQSDACVRFVHVSPSAGPVDIYVDGTAVAQGISYGAATQFAALSDNQHQIQIVTQGQSPDNGALYNENLEFGAGQAYQLSVLDKGEGSSSPTADSLEVRSDEVDITPLPRSQTRVRVYQAIDRVESADVSIANGADLAKGLGHNDVSDYMVIDAGAFDLQAVDNNGNPLASTTGQQFKEGSTYDVFLIGRASDQSTLQMLVLETPATVRVGAQGTPIAVPTQATSTPAAVGEASPTVSGSGATATATPSPIGTAPLTPVLTEEPTSTAAP